jgi:hypothetical protein
MLSKSSRYLDDLGPIVEIVEDYLSVERPGHPECRNCGQRTQLHSVKMRGQLNE